MVANNSFTLFIDIAQIVLSIAAASFFLWGLLAMVKGLKNKEDADFSAAQKKKSIIVLIFGCVLYFCYTFFADLESMLLADYNLIAVTLRSLLRTIMNTGFIPLIPVFLQRKRKYQ